MRIAHIYKDAYPPVFGGVEQHIALLASEQAALGHDVRIIAAGASKRAERRLDGGVDVLRLPELTRIASSPVTRHFFGVLRRLQADVAHFHHPNPVAELGEPLLSPSCRRVVSYHADITRQRVSGALYRPFLHRFLRRAEVIIVASPPMLASSPVLRSHRDRATVVPFGIAPVPNRPDRIPRHGLLFVGRLREYKGIPVLLAALARLPEGRLRIVGRGPQERHLQELAARLRVESRVDFLGDVDDAQLDDEYRRARALVLPSTRRSEAFGIVLVEALARGTPCLTTELGTGTSWVNLDRRTGRVVPPGDPNALAMAAAELLHDDAAWRRYSAGARERSALFTADRMVADVLAAYGAT